MSEHRNELRLQSVGPAELVLEVPAARLTIAPAPAMQPPDPTRENEE